MKDLSPEIQMRLEKAANIWIATVRSDGRPHLVPVWFVFYAGKFYVCTEASSVKARNMLVNAHVALALEEGSHPVICEGDAMIVENRWPDGVTKSFLDKYEWDISTEDRYTLLVEITPQKWLTW